MSATRCKKHIKQSSLDSIQDKTNQKPGQRYLKNTRGGSLDTALSQGTSGVTDIGRTSSPVLRRKRTGPTQGGSVNQAIPKHVTLDRATFPPPRLRKILRNRSGSADSAALERLRLFIPHRANDEDKAKTDDEAENLERKTSLSTPPAFLVPLLPTDKDEYLYMMVLRTIVNPLGAPDTLPGLTPGELADHVKQVFAIDDLDHGRWMQEVNNNKPANIVLNVTIVEGRNLRPTRAVGGVSAPVDPYCVLCICRPRNTRKASKSATSVPDLGQRSRRRRSSFDPGQVQRTSISSTPNPKWNDAFELSVHDFYEDELEVYIWDNHGGSDSHLGSCPPNKSSGLKSLFRQVKQSVDFGRPADEFIGHFRVPVREISAKGIDTWFDLYQDKKQKKKAKGTCRVRLELSAKESMDFVDGVLDANLSQYCSLEDFYEIVTTLYRHNIDLLLEEALELAEGVPAPELEQLSIQSRAVLDQVAIQQHVSKITQLLLELVVVLEMSCSEKTSQVVANTVVKNVIVALETEWTRIQRSSPGSDDMFSDKLMFTDLELSLFEGAASVYVERAVRNMTDIPKLFPPHELELEDLNNQVSLLVHLLNVHVWSYIDTAQKDLSHLLVQRLQTDVKLWVSAHINNANVASTSKDAVLADTKLMVTVLDEATQVCTPIYTVCQFFAKMGMDYFKTVSLTMESRLALKSQMLMQRMDTYQVTYQKFRVNILESSTLSLQLYMALRNYFNIIRGNIADRDVFRLTISGYQSWFETAVIFWLQTFRDEGQRRMEKALEIDKDVVLVTSLVKYSNSSVDVLSCFSKMTSEWRQIDFSDADICLLGVTKIADTICDGARQYAEKIESILETNGYYDIEQGQRHFDVTDRLCITMNNIEHVRQYLHELPRLLLFDVVTQAMSIKHEDDDVGHQSLNTLHSLVTSADDDIIMRQVLLVRRVTDKMAEETGKYMAKFMRVHERTLGSVDALLDYLETNLKVLDKRLESSIFPYVLHQLWEATLTCFSDTLLNGRPPEYYEQMIEHLRSLKAYFVRGVEEADLLDTPHLMELTARLELNSQTSEQLMLHFLHDIPASMDTPLEYLGSAALRVGCMQETGGNVTIYVTVVSGRQLPGVTRQGLINPYVTLALSPQTLFPHKVARTTTVHKSVNPVFNQTFQFSRIPQEFRLVHGGMLVVTMWHEATLLPDDVIGEVLLHLPDIRMMETHHTVEDLPTQLLPLHRHPEPTSGPYKVLQERSEWDHTASAFIHKRRIQAGYQPVFPFCAPVKALYNMVFGQRGASSGVYGTPPIL